MPPQLSAAEIDRKMREDLRRRLKDYGIASETVDPVLAVLFRTFAQQLETLYDNTERIRLSLLDEFLNGLAFEPRLSRAAQTIIRMVLDPGRNACAVPAGTELNAAAHSGERLSFITDASVQISNASIAVALAYQDKQLRLLSGVEIPESLRALRPTGDSVPCNLGPEPALFLAFENLPPQHLSGHSLFFDLSPESPRIQQALWSEPWCLVGAEGELSSKGVMRPDRGNSGVQFLRTLSNDGSDREEEVNEIAPLPNGFYAGRVFVFPKIKNGDQFKCNVPRGLEASLLRMFALNPAEAFSRKRAWIRISMPRKVPGLHAGVGSILLHAVSASNVECRNQTVRFETQGTSIPVSQEAGIDRFLVAPLAILGEGGPAYRSQQEPTLDANAGRFGVLNGRIELEPAKDVNGKPERFANLRIWTTAGPLGNAVGPGQVKGIAKGADFPGIRVLNPVSASGGTSGETYESAHSRLTTSLLSRDRIVTKADLERVVLAFDRRIVRLNNEQLLQRTDRGLQSVEKITVFADGAAFVDPNVELGLLKEDLQQHVEQRVLSGIRVLLEVLPS